MIGYHIDRRPSQPADIRDLRNFRDAESRPRRPDQISAPALVVSTRAN